MSVNRENFDKTASSEAVLSDCIFRSSLIMCLCFCRPFWQATSVQNYRTFTVNIDRLAHVNIEHLASIMYIYAVLS